MSVSDGAEVPRSFLRTRPRLEHAVDREAGIVEADVLGMDVEDRAGQREQTPPGRYRPPRPSREQGILATACTPPLAAATTVRRKSASARSATLGSGCSGFPWHDNAEISRPRRAARSPRRGVPCVPVVATRQPRTRPLRQPRAFRRASGRGRAQGRARPSQRDRAPGLDRASKREDDNEALHVVCRRALGRRPLGDGATQLAEDAGSIEGRKPR
jgi:hypothetical protein